MFQLVNEILVFQGNTYKKQYKEVYSSDRYMLDFTDVGLY